jgi:hypothetical protein
MWPFRKDSGDRNADVLIQQRLRLTEIWNTIHNQVPPRERPHLQRAIDQLREQCEPERRLLQTTEMQLGRFLPERLLHIEFLWQFDRLKEDKNPRFKYFKDLRDQLFSSQPQRASDAGTLQLKQMAYLELVNVLQEGDIRRRNDWHRFTAIAYNLAWVGLVCLAVFIVLMLVMYHSLALAAPDSFWSWRIVVALITLIVVISAGGLGAFFSRILNYQLRGKDLTIDMIYQYFHQNVMFMRMVVGAMGALVFFGLLSSHLLSGDGLPDFDKLGFGADTTKFSAREFSKLLFWLFAAGFSERLVPSSVDRTLGKQAGDDAK